MTEKRALRLPYSEELNIERFSHTFENKSESYKLFWFKAIMVKICEGQAEMTFDDLINNMILDAWYMVTEYHLNLGPSDNLEVIVKHIKDTTEFVSTSKRDEILEYIKTCEDREVNRLKNILSKNVPYRLQAPLLGEFTGESWKTTPSSLATRINQYPGLLYYFGEYNGLKTKIIIDNEWKLYLIKNQEIIRGWLDYNLIIYLQKRNPSVPGISDKLYPPITAKLSMVKRYWNCIIDISGDVRDIYGDIPMNKDNISIDHFVPWSFVAHDELWNLSPTTKSINSSKSNNLPHWNTYFPKLAQMEYDAYRITKENDFAKTIFEKCAEKHINSADIMYKLYMQELSKQEFTNQLEEIIRPVYNAAKNCGFAEWVCA